MNIRQRIKKYLAATLPENTVNWLRRIYYLPLDIFEGITGKRDDLTPPKGRIFVGEGDFRKVGEEFLKYLVEFGGLKPGEKVLDVGCGIGQMAVPLTRYLNGDAVYEGFDIVEDGIRWCREKITPKFKNFHFQLADIYNKKYNPKGRSAASKYTFPYEDGHFDVVFLKSVFTHMLPDDMGRYISEIRRVLKKGGRCFITYFLLDRTSAGMMKEGKSSLDFSHPVSNVCRVADERLPEWAVAYDEAFVKDSLRKAGLAIKEPVHHGSWSGREAALSYQDIVIAKKELA